MIKPTNPQAISRVLRKAGFNPHSVGDSTTRWAGLRCRRSLNEVHVRAWQHPESEQPSIDDVLVIGEIAKVLTDKGYKIRHKAGDHYLYVQGKEIKTVETKAEAPGTMKIDPEDPREHFDTRIYTRAIVPGTVPDIKRKYVSPIFRPDSMQFRLTRKHSAGRSEPWKVQSVTLSGRRVLKGGRLSEFTESDSYDLVAGPYNTPAPQDVIDYVTAVLDSLNAGE